MKYTVEEVMQYVREENVKFIRLAFCDVFGRQKNIAIMPYELKDAFARGIIIDAAAIAGFGGDVRTDLLLHPDPATLSRLPWRPESGCVVRMYCTVTHPDGRPLESDTRSLLCRAIDSAAAIGLHFEFGTQTEFYLWRNDEQGYPTAEPLDRAGYMDIAPEDKGENIRRDICLTLEQMGIQPMASHHERGPGQNEIDFRYSDALSAADNAFTFRSVVNAIALRNGLTADFGPRPLPDAPGSGMHINLSVHADSGEDMLDCVLAGILAKARELTVFLNPLAASYTRLGTGNAPRYVTWSEESRSVLIRIPGVSGSVRRAELRSPDPSANPYVAFAAVIYAGIYGAANHMHLVESAERNLKTASDLIRAGYEPLPASLPEAQNLAAQSSFVRDVFPAAIIASYTEAAD